MSERNESEGQHRILNLTSSGERLDKVLANELTELSRSQCQRLISDGMVTVDGKMAKASQRLKGGERIEVIIPEVVETKIVPQPIPLDIRYEDRDIVIVNKPAGMVVHPSLGHESGTMVNALLAHCPDIAGIGGERRPGIVHRLDKETSGLVVVAKNDRSLQLLQEQFRQREVKKIYLALVEGWISPSEMMIDAPIGRDPRGRKKMAVIPAGSSARSREAVTYVLVIERYRDAEKGEYTLVSCRPVTGRTHQIRVHLDYATYPIVGDKVYGRRKQRILADRHFLHAAELSIRHPSDGTDLTVQAPLPQELQDALEALQSA
ncbi:MAG: RluA family pseudouridine synthase [Candidatus Promineifilaceae bacterium]